GQFAARYDIEAGTQAAELGQHREIRIGFHAEAHERLAAFEGLGITVPGVLKSGAGINVQRSAVVLGQVHEGDILGMQGSVLKLEAGCDGHDFLKVSWRRSRAARRGPAAGSGRPEGLPEEAD